MPDAPIRLSIACVAALGVTAISLLLSAGVSAQNITPVSLKLDPGASVTVPFQSPGLNVVVAAVVTAGDGSPVPDVTARIDRHSPTSLSVIVTAAPVARPRSDYQVWLQTSTSKTLIRVATVQVVAKIVAPGIAGSQAERQLPREQLPMQRGPQVPLPQQTTPPAQTTPTLDSLAPAASTVVGGLPLRVDVRLTGPASTPVVVALQYSANLTGTSISMPQSVTVPVGQASTFFEVTAGLGATNSFTLGLRALYGGAQKDTSVNVLPDTARLVRVTLDSPSVTGGQRLHGQVVLSGPAAHATIVTLSMTQSGQTINTPYAQLPPSVTVPIGQTSVPFDITTAAVSSRVQLAMSAYYLASRQDASFSVEPAVAPGTQAPPSTQQPAQTGPPPQHTTPPTQTTPPPPSLALVSISVASPRVGGPSTVSGTISLNTIAPAGGTQVTLASDKPTVASVPATRLVPGGQSSVAFQISASVAAADTTVTVSATLGTVTRSAILTVGPPRLTRVAAAYRDNVLDTWSVLVELDGPAPPGGAVIALSSQNTAVARVPPTVTVPQGVTSWTAPIDFTRGTTMVLVTLTGVYGGVTLSGVVGVNPLPPPPVVASISPMSGSTGFAICGTNLGGFVRFGSRTLPAGISGGSGCPSGTIRLGFAIPSDLPPGAYTITVETAGGTWTSPQPFTLTAVGNTGPQNPGTPSQPGGAPAIASVTLDHTRTGGATTVHGTVTLSTVAPAGGVQVTLGSDTPGIVSFPSTPMSIPAGQSSKSIEFGTGLAAVDTVVTVSATFGGTTKTATLTVGPPRLSRVFLSYRDQVHDLWNVMTELDGPAPAGGAVVTLTSDNTAVARVPATITIEQHHTVGYGGIDFTRGTGPVSANVTATYGGVTTTTMVGVMPLPPPPAISSVSNMSAPPRGSFAICGTNLSAYITLGSRIFGASSVGGWGCPGESKQIFEVPENLTAGSYTMSMENAGGSWTSPQPFTVTAP